MGETKYCTHCGHPIGEGEKFCRNCGAPVQTNEGFSQTDTEKTRQTDQAQMYDNAGTSKASPQKSGNHTALIIVAVVVCIIIFFIIGIFIGRNMGNDTDEEYTEEVEDSVEVPDEEMPEAVEDESEAVVEDEPEEQAAPVQDEQESQSSENIDEIYGWSVDDDLELTTLEVVTKSDGTTLYMDFTNNTSSSIVIGWASASQANITDVNGNEYYVHFPTHTEIYASESRSIELQASGKIEAEISKIEIQGVCYIGSSGLPSNIGGSTVTYTVNN